MKISYTPIVHSRCEALDSLCGDTDSFWDSDRIFFFLGGTERAPNIDFGGSDIYCIVRFDLHRSTSPANFYVLRTSPYLQSINKEKQGMFNRFISWRIVATDINLQSDSNHRITGGDPSHWVY